MSNMKKFKILFVLGVFAAALFVRNDIAYAALPTVTTSALQNVNYTNNAVLGGGNITNNGGQAITVSGLVWNTSPSPTVALATKTTDGGTSGSWTSQMSSLSTGVTYYVRAYATNASGTAYGSELQFSLSSLNITVGSGGNVSSAPVGINCQGPTTGQCFRTYLTGTSITLTGSPDPSYSFGYFYSSVLFQPQNSNYCNSPCTFNLTSSRTVSATFVTMSGTLTGPSSCSSPIPIGGSGCTVNLNWSISYPESAPTAITASGMSNINVSNSTIPTTGQGGTQAVTVIPTSRTFYLYNNGKSLVPSSPSGAGKTVTATCASGSIWNGSICAASSGPVITNGSINIEGTTTNAEEIYTFGNTEYDIILTAQSSSGIDITSQYALINYQGVSASPSSDPTQYPSPNLFRGYIGWSNANFQDWGVVGPDSPVSCDGNGYYAKYNGPGFGQPYINISRCSTSVSFANGVFTRTTILTVYFGGVNFSYETPLNNTISSYAVDANWGRDTWDPSDTFIVVYSYPELTASPAPTVASPTILASPTPAPYSATTNFARTYTENIKNIGPTTTGISFPYFFQTNNGSHGTGSTTNGWASVPPTIGPLGPGASFLVTSPSMTFTSPGTYSIRVCADKANSGDAGTIFEPDEQNNCGDWTDIVVTNAPSPDIQLIASPSSGRVGHTTPRIQWSLTNMTSGYGPLSCTASTTCTVVSTCNNGTTWSGSKSSSDGSYEEPQPTINAAGDYTYKLSCSNIGGTTEVTTPVVVSPIANVSLTANNTANQITIYQGDPVVLAWSIANPIANSSCSSNNFNVGTGAPSGSTTVTPLSTITFKVTCDYQDATVQVIVKKKPGFKED